MLLFVRYMGGQVMMTLQSFMFNLNTVPITFGTQKPNSSFWWTMHLTKKESSSLCIGYQTLIKHIPKRPPACV